MSFSKLGQSFSRSSSRSKSSLGGRDGGYRRWPVAGVPITVGDYGGGFDRGMRFSRGYLASIGADKGFASKAYVSDFVAVLAKSRFGRRFFSGEAPNKKKNYENFYPGEKKEIPKANENQKRQKFESKEGSSLDGEEIIFRILSVLIGGLLCKWLIELLFYLPRYGVDEDDQISFQEFKNKLLEPGLVDHIVVVVDTSLALVFVKISLQNQTSNDVTEGDNPHIRRHEGQYNSYLEIVNVRTLEKKLEEAQIALGIDPNEFVPLIYVSLHQEQAKFLPKLLCTLGINAYMIWRTLKRTGIRAGIGGIFGIGKA